MKFRNVYITGDTHGDFDWLPEWCEKHQTTAKDALIILGDAGIMYYGEKSKREKALKGALSKLPITLLCVRGNHEARPIHRSTIQLIHTEDGILYMEPDYPNILYIADGSIFHINDKKCLIIGGAYSVDKEWRIIMNYMWFPDEELSDEEMDAILNKVGTQHFDFVFTHTCPLEWEPTYLFLKTIPQEKISRRMEKFLHEVKENITFGHWYFGHFHDHVVNYMDNVSILFQHVEKLI